MKILNSKGEPIVLSAQEQAACQDPDLVSKWKQAVKVRGIQNALGYERAITTLTTIMKKITEQKFYQVAPADYIPVRVGEGAWSSNLLTYRSFDLAGSFAEGVVNTGSNNGRLANADAGVDSLSINVLNWAKAIGWSIIDLELAAKSGNWDIVTAKEKARKRNWDLGIQAVAFLGLPGDPNVQGLLTLSTIPVTPGVAVPNASNTLVSLDTTTLATSIYKLASNPATLSTFIAQILNVYRANCQRSAWPTHYIIPESDYLGLATASSPSFPLKSILQYMQETLQTMTGNKNFKVLPCSYADGNSPLNSTGLQSYVLLNYAEESIRMDIPVDYTNTLANSIDNFSFQNVGFGQFTGVKAYRNLETYIMQFPTSQA